MDVTDLDVVVPEPKQAKLGGVVYDLPPDMPMEVFLRINHAAQAKDEDGNPDQGKQLTLLVDTMGDLFAFQAVERGEHDLAANIKETVKAVLMRRSLEFSFTLARKVYRPDDEADVKAAEGAAGPPDQAPGDGDSNGTKSTTTSPSQENPTVIRAAAASSA